MLSRFLFLFHRRSGQQKERTTGGADSMSGGQTADSWECGGRLLRGQREVHKERTARRTSGGEDSHSGGY